MSDDAIARAARALREAHDGASPTAATTRAAILTGAVARRRRRRSIVAVVAPLAAVLAATSAWAAVTGRLPELVERLLRREDSHGIVDRPSKGALPRPANSIPSAPTSAPQSDGPAPAQPEPPVVAVEPSAVLPRHVAAGASPAAIASNTASAEDDLYAAAHRAHFVAHDPAAALKGWDAYLAAYPRGRFSLEARYNRGLTLVRLGRTAEAHAALVPFADGTLGGYRQREARELLDALDAGP